MIGAPQRGRDRKVPEKIAKEIMAKFFKFDENYKPTDLRSSNPKHRKPADRYEEHHK